MTGDHSDFISRLRSALPARWFPDEAPVLTSLLSGISDCWVFIYSLLSRVRQQTRIATVSGSLLDAVSADFFGSRLPRRPNEPDTSFRQRVQKALVREHGTRDAISSTIEDLTGLVPAIFEPSRISDTGAYNSGTLGYDVAGAWGSLALPFQVFIAARRQSGTGIASIAGYGTGGPLARASLSQLSGQVTDVDILDAVTSVMPTASIAWIYITN